MKEKYERTQQSHLASEWVQSGEDSCGEDNNTPYSKMAANKLFFCLHVN